jgi:phosphatidate phosphatase APP1
MENSGHWEFRRSLQTAQTNKRDLESLVVTHPFHPLSGKQVPILFQRRLKRGGVIYICDGGEQGNATLPESFTDRGLPPASNVLTVGVLAELMAEMEKMKKVIDNVMEEGDLV